MKKKLISLFLLVAFCFSSISTVFAVENNSGSSDYERIIENWLNLNVGGDFDTTNPDYASKLNGLADTAQTRLDALNTEADRTCLFDVYPLGETDSTSRSNHIQFTYSYIKEMALAWATPGNRLYHDEDLKNAIVDAMEYMDKNWFGEEVFAGFASDKYYGNWFSWVIGCPMAVSEICLLMGDAFTADQMERYTLASRHYCLGGDGGFTGANGIWKTKVWIMLGALRQDDSLLQKAKSGLPGFFQYVASGDGFHEDGTFIQHNKVVYNGGYGSGMIRDLVELLFYLNDTSYELTQEETQNLFAFVDDSFLPVIHNGYFMTAFGGRDITRGNYELTYGGTFMATLVRTIQLASPEDADRYAAYMKAWLADRQAYDNFMSTASIYDIEKAQQILKDDSIQPIELGTQNYQFSDGDRVVQQTENYKFTVAMYSDRLYNYESGDSNTKGWHTGDGMTYVYGADSDQFAGTNKATIDWKRLPGTTVVHTESGPSKARYSNPWAGGTSIDGEYGTAGMMLHCTGQSLYANKSWFMFDNEIVALGSDIRDTSSTATIETILENYKLDEGRNNTLTVDGASVVPNIGDQTTIENAQWAHIEGNEGNGTGFYFPSGLSLTALRDERSGKWSDLGSFNIGMDEVYTDQYLTLWTDHGVKPNGAQYEYVILPESTSEETRTYQESPDITVLSNTALLHAVYEADTGLLAANNFATTEQVLNGVDGQVAAKITGQSSLILKDTGSGMKVSVSDPTHKGNTVTIELYADDITGFINANSRVRIVEQDAEKVLLEVNVADSAGTAIEFELTTQPLPTPAKVSAPTYSFEDDGIRVTTTPVDYATAYTVRYGTSPDAMNTEVEMDSSLSCVLPVKSGETLYFSVRGYNISGAGEWSDTVSAKMPSIFVEDFADFSKMFSYTASWVTEGYAVGSLQQTLANDTSGIKRGTDTPESVVYALDHMTSLELTALVYSGNLGVIEASVSEDGKDWTSIEMTYSMTGSQDWRRADYQATDIPETARFLKITVSNCSKVWAPQLTRLVVYMGDGQESNPIHQIQLNNSPVSLGMGDTFQMMAGVAPFNTDESIIWSSSNPDILRVNENGVITAVGTGKATIRVSNSDGSIYDEAEIQVITPNVALGKYAVASKSSSTAGFDPSKAVDGDTSTRWASDYTWDGRWIYVDLEAEYSIDTISFLWEGAYGKQYDVQIAPDVQDFDKNWTTVVEERNGGAGEKTYTFEEPITARYVKMNGLQTATKYGYSLYEFAVHGVPVATTHSVTVNNGTGSGAFVAGDTVTITANPAEEGMQFAGWEAEGFTLTEEQKTSVSFSFTMPDNDVTLSATYEEIPKPINKSLLQSTYDYALTCSTEGVTDTAREFFEKVLAEAQLVLDDPNATQEQVDLAWNNLLEGIWGLGLVQGDKAELEKLVAKAQDMMKNQNKYVTTHWQQLVDVLAEAEKVLAYGDALEEDVFNASHTLLNAILMQRYQANKENLNDLIQKMVQVEPNLYTTESFAVFHMALENAKLVSEDETLTDTQQSLIDQATAELSDAFENLVLLSDSETSQNPEDEANTDNSSQPDQNSDGEQPQTGERDLTIAVLLALSAFMALTLVLIARKRCTR